ncbi:neuropilin and tolloid-like protein 2 [Caerostris extrusa]|uniref:Neuropilin and tolloid-like protein 2 n=1 Tax=Caerostris extrusa TaxID=172846 RepID=A0AAV4NFT2_CAEEX|nr:neuropilin and tolloid-like protein 2 [Caerostris extrusa]
MPSLSNSLSAVAVKPPSAPSPHLLVSISADDLPTGKLSRMFGKLRSSSESLSSIKGAKQALESVALTDLSEDIRCFNFSKGNADKMEFYSPNYPNNYPKSIKCIPQDHRPHGKSWTSGTSSTWRTPPRAATTGWRSTTARTATARRSARATAGASSPSRCSPPRDTCGCSSPPTSPSSTRASGPSTTSSSCPTRVKMLLKSKKSARSTRRATRVFVKKSEMDDYFYRNRHEDSVECMWIIETEADKNLYLNFKDFNLYKPNDCDQNFLQIFPDTRSPDKEMAQFCGTTAEPRKSSSNITYIRLFTQRDAYNKTNFVIHFSSFRDMKKEGRCDPKTEFNCGDQTCIDISLQVRRRERLQVQFVMFPFACSDGRCDAADLGAHDRDPGGVLQPGGGHVRLHLHLVLQQDPGAAGRERECKERRSKEASVEVTLDRSLQRPRDDESSDGGCYVPEVDFRAKQRTNGGDTVPKKPIKSGGSGTAFQQQHYPYISESFESLQSDVIVPPAPPPVPAHMKERREISPPPPTYRIVGGKVRAGPLRPDQGPGDPRKEPVESKTNWLRGPLEAGAPRSAFNRQPGEIGLPKFGMSRVTPGGPMAQSKGPLWRQTCPLVGLQKPLRETDGQTGLPSAKRDRSEN